VIVTANVLDVSPSFVKEHASARQCTAIVIVSDMQIDASDRRVIDHINSFSIITDRLVYKVRTLPHEASRGVVTPSFKPGHDYLLGVTSRGTRSAPTGSAIIWGYITPEIVQRGFSTYKILQHLVLPPNSVVRGLEAQLIQSGSPVVRKKVNSCLDHFYLVHDTRRVMGITPDSDVSAVLAGTTVTGDISYGNHTVLMQTSVHQVYFAYSLLVNRLACEYLLAHSISEVNWGGLDTAPISRWLPPDFKVWTNDNILEYQYVPIVKGMKFNSSIKVLTLIDAAPIDHIDSFSSIITNMARVHEDSTYWSIDGSPRLIFFSKHRSCPLHDSLRQARGDPIVISEDTPALVELAHMVGVPPSMLAQAYCERPLVAITH
jgi:hypothetical protein